MLKRLESGLIAEMTLTDTDTEIACAVLTRRRVQRRGRERHARGASAHTHHPGRCACGGSAEDTSISHPAARALESRKRSEALLGLLKVLTPLCTDGYVPLTNRQLAYVIGCTREPVARFSSDTCQKLGLKRRNSSRQVKEHGLRRPEGTR